MSLEITEDRIARQPPESQAIIRVLLAKIGELEGRLRELESRLGKTPQNSSLPPSSQHPHAKPPPSKSKSKRKRGGQPGHGKHERTLIPTKECTHLVTLKPQQCRRCGKKHFTVFALRPTRAATVLDELLGDEFTGVMTCDRAKMYWRCGRLQWCWAHLKRAPFSSTGAGADR